MTGRTKNSRAPAGASPLNLPLRFDQSHYWSPQRKSRQSTHRMVGVLRGRGVVILPQGHFEAEYHIDAFAFGAALVATGSLEGAFSAALLVDGGPVAGTLALEDGALLEIAIVEADESLIEFDLDFGPTLKRALDAKARLHLGGAAAARAPTH